jgi:4-amino-4-deoxychorismate lyase
MSLLGAWLDGAPLSALPPTLRAAHYGDGVFRTLRRDAGHIALQTRHVARLCSDAAAIGIPLAAGTLEQALAQPALPEDAALKICVWRGGGGRGYRPDPAAAPHIAVYAYALPEHPAAHWTQGVEIVRLAATLSRAPRLAGIKHCNRLDQVLAAQELAAAGAAEGLCGDGDGNFVCGTRSNVFARVDGVLCTPPIVDCGIRGVMRERLCELAEGRGIAVRESPFNEGLLARADAMMLSNSLIGVWPVARLDGRALPGSAGLARALLQALGPPFFRENAPACVS